MHYGICCTIEDAVIARTAETDYLEVNVQNLLRPLEPDEVFAVTRDAAASSPVPLRAACCFLPGKLPCVGPAVDLGALLAYADTAFVRAAAVGIETIVFGSGGSRRIPDGFDRATARAQFLHLLRELAPRAADAGITVVVEPLNRGECNFITSVAEGATLVEDCDHPGVRLLADLYHMGKDDEDPAILTTHAALLHHLHIATFPDRRAPGGVPCDFSGQIAALQRGGYDGTISIEATFDDLAHELPGSLAHLRGLFGAGG